MGDGRWSLSRARLRLKEAVRRVLKPEPDYRDIPDRYGIMTSVSDWSEQRRLITASARNYRARTEIALDVASNYPGGDYLEFGAGSLNSFRSFLGAFDLFGHTTRFPNTRFYAFDIFGNPDHGRGPSEDERAYFEHWRNPYHVAAPVETLDAYGVLKDRCVLVPGYFQDTLTDEFKALMKARKIGFTFLDVNIASSYKFVFDFLLEVMRPERMFIEIDEYFEEHTPAIHPLYDDFAKEAKRRYGLDSLYMRNAGAFGALFCLIPGRG